MSGLQFRPMRPAEIELAIEWAAREGWNPGLHDAETFGHVDPEGFWIGEIGRRMIACISAVRYDDIAAFLGCYIVEPEDRGKGYGMALWNHAIERLGNRAVGLDGVLAQQANYQKSGFRFAYRQIRFEGLASGVAPQGLADLSEVIYDEVACWLARSFPFPRAEFDRLWWSQPACHRTVLLRDGRIAGIGLARPCRKGWKIGPLLAEDPSAADAVYRGLAARLSGEIVSLDVPEPNEAAVALARQHGLSPAFETARMYRPAIPEFDTRWVYGVTSFELG